MQASTRRGRQGIEAGRFPTISPRTIGPDISDHSVACRVVELSLTIAELTPQVETDIRELLEIILTQGRFEYAFQVVAYACALEKESDARLLALVLDLILQRIRDDPRAEVHDCVRLCRVIGTEVLPTLQDGKTLDLDGKPVVGTSLFRLYLLDRCKLFMQSIWQAKEYAVSLLSESSESSEAAQIAAAKWINFMEFIDGLFGQYVLGEDIVHAVIDQQMSSVKWTNRELNKILDILSPSRRFAQLCKTSGCMDSYCSRVQGLEKTGALDPEMYTRLMSCFARFNSPTVATDFETQSKLEPDKNEIHTHPLVHNTANISVPLENTTGSPAPNTTPIPQFDPVTLQDNKLHVDATTPLTAVIAFFTQVAQPLIANFTSELESATFSENPISDTAISEVWRATLRRGAHVAVKCIKSTVSGNDKAVKHTARELAAWSQQQHVNVLQLLGVALYRGKLAMVSEWMEQGSVTNVVNQSPEVNRHSICVQVARVVAWLHRKRLIHGDLKGANILMSNDGIPKVTDFGLTVMSEGEMQFSETFAGGGTMRWMAPELFQDNARKSFKTDVYALGMTLLEILTGQHPFPEITSPQRIIKAVSLDKQIPKRPGYLAEKTAKNNVFWDAMVRCWVYDPDQRATAEEVEMLISSAEDTAQGLMKSVAAKRDSMCSSCTLA